MSHPVRFALFSRHALKGLDTAGFCDLAGPENVRQASVRSDPGESVLVMLLYAK
jgi:hypothetical protein